MLSPDALIFNSKCTKMRFAAGLRPDPLGSLSAPPDPLTAKTGHTSKGMERGKGGMEGTEEEGKGEEKGEWRGGKGGREGREEEGRGRKGGRKGPS